jgi:hypothetical protein
MKRGPARTAIRIGATICSLGMVCYGIEFVVVRFSASPNAAFPFAVVGFFLSMPCAILAGTSFDNPSRFVTILPMTLVLNSMLISGIVWAFLRVKMVTDRKVYGDG